MSSDGGCGAVSATQEAARPERWAASDSTAARAQEADCIGEQKEPGFADEHSWSFQQSAAEGGNRREIGGADRPSPKAEKRRAQACNTAQDRPNAKGERKASRATPRKKTEEALPTAACAPACLDAQQLPNAMDCVH